MSITKDFESRVWRDPPFEDRYSAHDVRQLLAYARSLEELLEEVRDDLWDCANLQLQYESYRPDRYKGTAERLARVDEVLKEVKDD